MPQNGESSMTRISVEGKRKEKRAPMKYILRPPGSEATGFKRTDAER
jgi:hypothetical protein